MPPSPDRPRVALVAPDRRAHGGVAGFAAALLDSPLAERYRLIAVVTHRDGSRARKAATAAGGLLHLAWLCAAHRVDLVHVNASWNASIVRKAEAVRIAHAFGVPVVLQLHGSSVEHGLRHDSPHASTARAAARRADAVVAATPAWAADAAELLGVQTVEIVPNACAASSAPAERDPEPATLLFLGRLERAKGVFELVDAAAELLPARPQLRLVLAGDGRDTAAVRALVAKRGLDQVTSFPGWVDEDERRALLARATCLVIPSHAEGLPLTLLEGLAGGVPVVATSVGGIPEAVRAGREALLVQPRDTQALTHALARLLDDPKAARRLARAGAARAKTYFDIGLVAAELGTIYDRLLGIDHQLEPPLHRPRPPRLDRRRTTGPDVADESRDRDGVPVRP